MVELTFLLFWPVQFGKNWSWERGVNGRDIEMLSAFVKTRPRRDIGTCSWLSKN